MNTRMGKKKNCAKVCKGAKILQKCAEMLPKCAEVLPKCASVCQSVPKCEEVCRNIAKVCQSVPKNPVSMSLRYALDPLVSASSFLCLWDERWLCNFWAVLVVKSHIWQWCFFAAMLACPCYVASIQKDFGRPAVHLVDMPLGEVIRSESVV